MLKFDYNEAVNIETENPGVLEVPEGKNVEDLPIKHFVDIANRKGLSTVTRALNNLQVWNKNKNKELSKWAGNMIDKVSKRFENQQKNESMTKESIRSYDVTLDLAEEKELAEFIDWLNEVNIPVAKVNRKFKNITLKNRDDLDEASFYLQDRDYFKKLHDFGWIVSVRA